MTNKVFSKYLPWFLTLTLVFTSSFFWFAQRAEAAVAYVAQGASSAQTGASYSRNVNAGVGTDRFILASIGIEGTSVSVSNMTYAGSGMTFLRRDTNGTNCAVEMWYIVAPATGTNAVAVTLSGAANTELLAMSFSGVDQSTPIDAQNSASGTGISPSVSITTVTNNTMIVDHDFLCDQTGLGLSPDNGQTARNQTSTINGEAAGGTLAKATAGSQTVGYTDAFAASGNWVATAVALKQSVATPATPVNMPVGVVNINNINDDQGSVNIGPGGSVIISNP